MLQTALTILFLIAVIGALVVIITDNRHPGTKVAWIMVILVLPVLGLVLYLLFGLNIRHHWMFLKHHQQSIDMFLREKDEALENLLFSHSRDMEVEERFRPLARLLGRDARPCVTGNNSLEIITTGRRKFELLVRDLENAKESIHIEYFHFGADSGSEAIRDILVRKAAEGVKVRFINENIANLPIFPHYYDRMKKAGVEVVKFTDPRRHVLDMYTSLNYRDHRKIVVIDGKIGYVGGMNINNHYFLKWRDTHLRLTGDAVSGLQYAFLDSWITSGGTLDRPMTDLYPMLRGKVQEETAEHADALVQIVPDDPLGAYPVIRMGLEWALNNAREYIYIQTPYFVPPESVMSALKTAALSGVDVRLMLPEKVDTPILGSVNRSYYEECLEAGVRIFERGGEFIHSKTFVCDGYLSCIGSSNLDYRSFNESYEINVYIYGSDVASSCREIFLKDLGISREVTLEQLRSTPWHRKLWRKFLSLFSTLM